MFQEEYINLIHRNLKKEISPVEQQKLDQWLIESNEHKQIANDIRYAWELSGNFDDGYTPNLEQGLSKFKARIQQDTPSVQQPEAKVVSITRRNWLSRIAAAAAVLIATSIFWMNYNNNSNLTIQSLADQTKEIRLDDGTIVYLNENSSLSYPEKFDGSKREVELKGEAYFDVEKDPEHPFIIHTKDVDVEVLGTSFNVRAYAQDTETSIYVKEGKVRFTALSSNEKVILVKNGSATYNRTTRDLKSEEDTSLNPIAWHTNTLNFENSNLDYVAQILERSFNANINIKNPTLKKCAFTQLGIKTDADLEDILNAIKTTLSGIQVDKKGTNTYTLSGDACIK